MKQLAALLVSACLAAPLSAGEALTYQVDGKDYEGYFVSPASGAPLVLLIHDWDGLTGYEVKRAEMLAEMGYAVFAADLFGAGVRPTRPPPPPPPQKSQIKDLPWWWWCWWWWWWCAHATRP